MISNLDLFLDASLQSSGRDLPYRGQPPHVSGSSTSEAAAHEIEPNAASLRGKVLKHIRAACQYGCTDDEIEVQLAMKGSTVRPRRRELQLGGLIAESGEQRKTRTNRQAVVWVAKEFKPLSAAVKPARS